MVNSFTSFNAILAFAVLVATIAATTIGAALALDPFSNTNMTTNTTGTGIMYTSTAATAVNPNMFQPTTTSGGKDVFYVIILGDGSVRPATAAERTATDVAIANGAIDRSDLANYLGRGLN